MKYKIKSEMCATKRDWVLWSGTEKDQCVQIGGLFNLVPCNGKHDHHGNLYRYKQLTFQSRKAAIRWVRNHTQWIIDDYKKRNAGGVPCWVMGTQWHGKGVFYINLHEIWK